MHSSNNTIIREPNKPASHALIFVHGRGDASDKMEELARQLDPEHLLLWIFPKADNATWYPMSFLAPRKQNEPYFGFALENIQNAIKTAHGQGIPDSKIILLGFSQGACLALDVAARNARRFAAIFVLSGGLIGPEVDPQNYQGDFLQTPIFMGCSDIDHHIPLQRLYDTEKQLKQQGADVTLRVYPGEGHLINDDEMTYLSQYFHELYKNIHEAK